MLQLGTLRRRREQRQFGKCTVGGSCTIADADGHNTYMSATWTKLPYMGEVGGNACIDGVKVSADPTPTEGYFTK